MSASAPSPSAAARRPPNGGMPSRGAIVRLTLPQLGLMLCHLVISMTDIWATGKLGANVQAAIGVVVQIYTLLVLITSLIASGCMTTISQSLGAGLALRANRYAGLIIILSASMGTAVALPALLLAPFIFTCMGISADVRPELSTFFTAYCCQLPFQYVLVMVNSIFRAHKKVVLPLLTLLLMAAANLMGDLGFGLGYFGIAAYGSAGIAWTTFACAVIGLANNFALARHYGLLQRSTFAPWKWNRRAMPYLFKVGIPAAAGQILIQAGSLANLAIIGLLPESTSVLAGMSVGSRIHAMLLFPLGALNMSMVILSGHLLGGDRRGTLYALGRKMTAIAGMALVPPSLLLWLLRAPVAGIFSADPSVLDQASLFLVFGCCTAPFMGMTSLLHSLFSGAGATLLSCRVGAVTCWALGIPLALGMGVGLGWGAAGVYAAGAVGQLAAFFWSLHIFRQKKWFEYGLRKRHTT